MSTELLKEVLMPFNTREIEYFNEATKSCTAEQKLAVAKRMSEEKPPDGYQFTESQIKRFVTQDRVGQANWYPGITINNDTPITESDSSNYVKRVQEFKERQYKAYRASGMSEAESRSLAGL